MINSEELLRKLQGVDAALPEDIKSALGSFLWKERLSNLTVQDKKIVVNFYSDGLNLALKVNIENIIRELVNNNDCTITVFFEKKEKQKAAPPENPAPAKPHNHSHSHQNQTAQSPVSNKKPILGVNKIIAVASGKGGVGKSTVSVNLALALYNQGYKVGILDADIYGPSIPTMLNIHGDPKINSNNKIIPLEAFGIKIMSFGFFAPEESAVIWRGPMLMKALQQFFWDVEWGELDFLILDLPPGTGDAQLTIVQSLPIAGAVIVTTPQNIALLDAVKAIMMFQKTDVRILGVIENMSTYVCPSCSAESHIFGKGGADRISAKYATEVLGHVPLLSEIRHASDAGEPLTLKANHPVRIRFSEIAEKMVKSFFN